ncbi:uncharacterized protein LOC108253156 [Diaphorina citri]|uniref:Uncharacterized protein LOC108253156 n=1 Tax=Diaphorina citri TaxID=121845 RepID=A0A1S4EIR1_DIACI|nr:uncharacterized protein LOC108253156 [Diaphorina citri]KAI5755895.1 hypothetical protein M8J77_020476 [Diaphorina citri]
MNASRSRTIGPSLRICQINIEGLSASKSDYLLLDHNIDILLIQETHTSDSEQINSRGKISGFDLVSSLNHPKYGIATYVKNEHFSNTAVIDSSISPDNLFSITIKLNDISISNVYKPPSANWPLNVHPTHPHPSVYLGDFNSHHTQWGYSVDDTNGEQLIDWAESHHLHLVHDAKQIGTFHSARWGRDYNPDLCFISSNSDGQPTPCSREVLPGFPHSQHRPVIIDVGIKVPLVSSVPKPRWNFQKADWKTYSKKLDDSIRFIPPISSNYRRFTKLVKSVASC